MITTVKRRVFLLLVTAAIVAFSGWQLSLGKPTAKPNVLLITFDTLRADRLGCYGSTTTHTPSVDRLASEGTLFENAAAPMPITRPSHFSIFTSLYPRDHGVVHNGLSLPDGTTTIASVFRDAGYRTAAFVGVKLLDQESGAARGFQSFNGPTKRRYREADKVVPQAVDWFKSSDYREPFFVWVHVFDAHMPYAPPKEYVHGTPPAGLQSLQSADWDTLIDIADKHNGDLSAEVFDWVKGLYGGEIEHADHWIGVLLDALRARGILDQTIVAFAADHGECFEHGIFFEHFNCLYEGATHVPVIFRYPARVPRGARETRVVEHIDIAPTLLWLADVPIPQRFEGQPLFKPDVQPERYAFIQHPLYRASAVKHRAKRARIRTVVGEPSRPLFSQEEETQIGLRSETWKYIKTGDKEEELYNLKSDSREQHNVAAEQAAVLSELRPAVEGWVGRHPLQPPKSVEMTEELKEQLRALGYME